jgi:hypothetical protein
LLDKLTGIEDLINFIDEQLPNVSSEGEYRQQLVTLMRSALHTWEVTTQKSKIELAEESSIWAVSIDDGRLRTLTFDRYSRIETATENSTLAGSCKNRLLRSVKSSDRARNPDLSRI